MDQEGERQREGEPRPVAPGLVPAPNGDDVIQQGDPHSGMKTLVDPVVDLDEDGRRDHEGFVCLLDQGPTGDVVLV